MAKMTKEQMAAQIAELSGRLMRNEITPAQFQAETFKLALEMQKPANVSNLPPMTIPGFEEFGAVQGCSTFKYYHPDHKMTFFYPAEIIHLKTGMELVFIPAGTCLDQNNTKITVERPFYSGKYCVTNQEFGNQVTEDTKDLPVCNVDWDTCMKWANDNGFVLPSIEELQYMMKGGRSTTYFWGNSEEGHKLYCNINSPGPVGKSKKNTFLPNPFGLYHIIGDMWQWSRTEAP